MKTIIWSSSVGAPTPEGRKVINKFIAIDHEKLENKVSKAIEILFVLFSIY